MHAPYKHFDRHLDAIRERLAAAAGPAAAGAAAAEAAEAAAAHGGQAAVNGGPTSSSVAEQRPLYVVCRRGNDSQRAVAALRRVGISHGVDVVGGIEAWAREVDPTFPTY